MRGAEGEVAVCGIIAMPGVGTSGAVAAGAACGMEVGAGTGVAPSVLLNEPIGGGALEVGAAMDGADISDPGSGGALALGAGIANWPISGTPLDTGAGSGWATAIGPTAAAGSWVVVSSFSARLICTTASTHSVPQASAEERSRSEARMVEEGVTGC